MALIHKRSRCAICEKPLDRPYTATSGCAFESDHHLWRYCDAPLHLDCLSDWPLRREFSRGYYDRSLGAFRAGPRGGTVLVVRDAWFLACGPVLEDNQTTRLLKATPGAPYYVEAVLADWPLRLYSRWHAWEGYIDGGFRQTLVGPALDAAEQVISELHLLAPTSAALDKLRAERAR
jgi:hypothetical protein